MAYTQEQLNTLRDAMASGVLRVRGPDGQETLFRNLAEMRQMEALMVAELAPSQARITRTRYIFSRDD